MSAAETFPYPIPEYDAERFWAACNENKLEMQKCRACDKFRWQPAPLCTFCRSDQFDWIELSGKGRINTWTVVAHPVHPAAAARVPYVVVEVELAEQAGLCLISNLTECDHDAITMEMAVELDFVSHPDGQRLPIFKPARP